MSASTRLVSMLARLERASGRPKPPPSDPLEMILWENVAYLVDDERRAAAFRALRKQVGLEPRQILSARPDRLLEVARLGGMHPELRVKKLLTIAQIAVEKFGGDVSEILRLPLKQAKKALKLFPCIGDPGAEKILLFTRTQPILALESNGLRVLVRLGFGRAQKNYAATYRSAQEAVKDQVRQDCAWLIRAHQLLRRHGQQVCRSSRPLCDACPVSGDCEFYRAGGFAKQ